MTPKNDSVPIDRLRDLLGDRLSTGASVLDLHSRDEAYQTPALPDAVVFPETTAEVAEIMKICSQARCPVTPFGVGSSLEGHVIPFDGGVSLDTTRMNQIVAIHPADLDAVVQPGLTRTRLNAALRDTGLMFSVDPGADATLGGMAATRASGTNSVRYGTMRDNVLALEVVLADGRIIRTGTRSRKSSAGYDLTRLFVGSEGTLGIITELTVRLYGQPESSAVATCAFETIEGAVDTVILAIQSGLPVARIELLDEVQIAAINRYNADLDLPESPHLFLEFHGSELSVAEQAKNFGELASDHGGSTFAWANKTEDRSRLWRARHEAYPAAKALRPGCEGFITDVCVPISALAECIAKAKEAVAESGLIAPLLGHVGDGNFHLIVLIDPANTAEVKAVGELAHKVNKLALSYGGTVTGEHGVGVGKKQYMFEEHGEAYGLMGDIKALLDPLNILNPGKLVTRG